MTKRQLRRLLKAQRALEVCLPWVDRLVEMECRKVWKVGPHHDITVMHSNGFREFCEPPKVERLPWAPR